VLFVVANLLVLLQTSQLEGVMDFHDLASTIPDSFEAIFLCESVQYLNVVMAISKRCE
jgi:hypothetical protein